MASHVLVYHQAFHNVYICNTLDINRQTHSSLASLKRKTAGLYPQYSALGKFGGVCAKLLNKVRFETCIVVLARLL